MELDILFTHSIITNIFNDDKFQTTMWNLFDRWEDEKEYEDINDYACVVKKFFNINDKAIRMTKRPFGFKFISNYSFTASDGSLIINKSEISFQFYSNGKCKWSAKLIK